MYCLGQLFVRSAELSVICDGHLSWYGVSIRSDKQKENFSIDGFVGRKLTMQWFKDHQATGAFINAGDWKDGPASVENLKERDSAQEQGQHAKIPS